MTLDEWQSCLNPMEMLHSPGVHLDTVPTARWRLFMVGCLQMIPGGLPEETQQIIRAVEDYVRGHAPAESLEKYIPETVRNSEVNDANNIFQLDLILQHIRPETPQETRELQAVSWRLAFVTELERQDIQHADGYGVPRAHDTFRTIQLAVAAQRTGPAPADASDPDHPWHAAFMSVVMDVNVLGSDLLRCVVGHPFHHLTMDPSWNSSTVEGLLKGIHEDRGYDRLPILADALEEAGCTETFLLNHCRYQFRHAVGCWAAHLPKPAPLSKSKTSSYWPLRTT